MRFSNGFCTGVDGVVALESQLHNQFSIVFDYPKLISLRVNGVLVITFFMEYLIDCACGHFVETSTLRNACK